VIPPPTMSNQLRLTQLGEAMIRAFSVLILFASVGHAELPPGSYDKLRMEAPDAVTIQVAGVKEATVGGEKQVTVEAKVLGVERSKSGLKVGDAVTIRYGIPLISLPGPRPIPFWPRKQSTPRSSKKRLTDSHQRRSG
jgi:hypothetical protein